MTLKELMDQLGFPSGMGDLDESLKWALVELHLRRGDDLDLVKVPGPHCIFEWRPAIPSQETVPFGHPPPQFDDRF